MDLIKPILQAAQSTFFIITGLLGIGFLIGFHELGHFLFCKIFSIRTPSFSIGFGPRIISKKIGETEFSLSAIPLGGYVEMAGSAEVGQGDQKEAFASDEHSFAAKPYYQKLLVMLGGILFNLIFAYATFILIFAMGLPKTEFLYPKNANATITTVQAESAAEKAGLMVGDTITQINNVPVENHAETIYKTIKPLANAQAHLVIQRNGQSKEITINLGSRKVFDNTIGDLGAIFEMVNVAPASFIDSIKKGTQLANAFVYSTVNAFKHIFSKKDTSQMAGPIRIISETAKGAQRGIKVFLIFLSIISINLAILNLIPLPILDGGQILFYTIEAIIRRPLPEMIRYYIHLATWIGMLALILYFSFKDIKSIFFSC